MQWYLIWNIYGFITPFFVPIILSSTVEIFLFLSASNSRTRTRVKFMTQGSHTQKGLPKNGASKKGEGPPQVHVWGWRVCVCVH